MGTKAAKLAVLNSCLKPNDIDLIIVATTTPDNTFPSTASKIQKNWTVKLFHLIFKRFVRFCLCDFYWCCNA